MPEFNLRSIEPLVMILLVLVHLKCAQTKRRKQCLTAWKVTGLTRLFDAQPVEASLVSSGIIRGGRRFAPGSASIASRRAATVTAIGYLVPNRFRLVAHKAREALMTLQISQRGEEYLKTAQTLLRAAKTMADQAIAARLKTLADDYERRAEKASLDDASTARSAASVE